MNISGSRLLSYTDKPTCLGSPFGLEFTFIFSIWIQVISVAVANDFTIPIADSNDISKNKRTQLNFRKSIPPRNL